MNKISKSANRCGHCSKEFPKDILGAIPFDIVINHGERWQYLKREKKSADEPDFHLKDSHKKLLGEQLNVRL